MKARQKHLQTCLNASLACVQQKSGDNACLEKAQKTCVKQAAVFAPEPKSLEANARATAR